MKLGVLFSGGKDSTLAAYLAKNNGHELACLITIKSENLESYMFHTPSIDKVEAQAEVMNIPLIVGKTKGEKEEELIDLENAIKQAITEYKIEGVITGAVGSVYQESRISNICNKLGIKCVNPLWQKDQFEVLNELIKNKFEVIIVGVFAYPLTNEWLGRVIDEKFVSDVKTLHEKYKIHVAGEGGEFESFVLNCPLFEKRLEVKSYTDLGEKNSWRREIEVE
ncbi:diphthine--ammonia ligase [Candidatus Pacearchaeota archaeon]|nr:diphthine--ammonia ligase [Candidatus Pacearchaeota archaeon]